MYGAARKFFPKKASRPNYNSGSRSFERFLMRQIGEWLAASAAVLGPGGIFLVALADNAFIPLPQGVDALLVAQAIAAPSTVYLAAGLGVIGSVIGSVILYFIARKVGHAMLSKRVSEQGMQRMQRMIEEFGAMALIPAAAIPLPLPMKPVVLAAGIFQMPLGQFCVAIAFARVIRYFGVAFLALLYGDGALTFAKEHAVAAVMLCAALVAGFYFVNRWSNRWLSRDA